MKDIQDKKEILTGNITRIDDKGLVTIKFSHNLDDYMFNVTKSPEYSNATIPRYLEENHASVNDFEFPVKRFGKE